MPDVINLAHGDVAIDSRPILRDIDLRVASGEVVALLGPNGSGKSTLVKTLVGLWPLTSGTLDIFGVPFDEFREWPRLGYVPQHSTITQGVPTTVQEVVASGVLSRRRPLFPMSGTDRQSIRDAIDAVGLGDRRNQQVTTLSGGQQQRMLIARALAGRPDLLLLDEPNAGVDLQSQAHIAEILRTLVDGGATLVVVLHELGPLQPLISRAVALREGRIVYDGAPDDVLELHDPAHHHDHSHTAGSVDEAIVRPPL